MTDTHTHKGLELDEMGGPHYVRANAIEPWMSLRIDGQLHIVTSVRPDDFDEKIWIGVETVDGNMGEKTFVFPSNEDVPIIGAFPER